MNSFMIKNIYFLPLRLQLRLQTDQKGHRENAEDFEADSQWVLQQVLFEFDLFAHNIKN